MAIRPDLQTLQAAAAAVERTAAEVDADSATVNRQLGALPWTGARRERVLALADAAVSSGQRQAEAERALARALRELAAAVERSLEELALLAARARQHLEELLARAQALAARAAQEVATAARSLVTIAFDLATGDPNGALRAAQALASQVEQVLQSITVRLQGLPPPDDPVWRSLGEEILRWQPL